MSVRQLLLILGLLVLSPVLAQTPVPLPGKLAGDYQDKPRRGGKIAIIPVELADMVADGERVRGVVSDYRSPAGNCVSDNTPFKGTYKDGTLSIKSERLKSQFADGSPCGSITIEVKLEGGKGRGTLTAGANSFSLDLEGK